MQKLLVICVAIAYSYLAIQVGQAAGDEPTQADTPTISQIMGKAHTNGRPKKRALDQLVVAGTATDEDKAKLLSLYQALSRAEPRRGNLEEWRKATQALVAATEAAIKGEEKAGEKLAAAANCKSCHDRFRPVLEADGTIVVDQGVYGKSRPPEVVMIANVSKDRTSLTIYSTTESPVTTFKEEEVEQDGVKRTVKVPVQNMKRVVAATKLPYAYWRLFGADGKEIIGDDVWKRLTPGAIVLRQLDATKVDPAYLRLFAADAVILVPTIVQE